MGTFSGPEGGTSTLEKRQRSIQMKGTSTVELQKEAPKGTYASQKKVLKEILLCIDWQKYSNIFQEDTQNIKIWFEFFFQMSVSGERDNWKEPSKYLET